MGPMRRLLALFLALAPILGYADVEVPIKNGSATAVSKDKSGMPVAIVLRAEAPSTGFPFVRGYRWGTEVSSPEAVVTGLEIKVGKGEVFVPLSAYADLANPSSVRMDLASLPYRLHIRGGDASVAYEAQLIFTRRFVVRRRVANLSFPESAWEETRYSYNNK